MPQQPSHTNALIDETSPYLLQHAHNPVDWLPWGETALSKAREGQKPIFLSIGYAACHWCHVMEHESFEDEAVAKLLNAEFVPIKVDREERPDLDEIYMSATMVFSGGHGGWPMSVFLAPDLRPIYAGTYFPKDNAYGRPGFRTILTVIAQRWKENREALLADSDKVVDVVRHLHDAGAAGELIGPDQAAAAAERLHGAFDDSLGGMPSGSNKFPPSMAMDLLLRLDARNATPRFKQVVELTLEHMGDGGIYDHLGGGLHRYSTDPKWLVPHFEKMLYDQALVASIYIDGMQATQREELKKLCENRARGICDYVLRDLTSPDGAFYSSEDADSDGLEGKFYIWTLGEIRELLEPKAAAIFASHYDVSEFGNWAHPGDAHVPHGPKNILRVVRPAETIAKLEGMSVEEVEASLEASRKTLLEARDKRVRPGLDDKVLCGWNGLMITALAKAGAALDEPRYIAAAGRAADFVLREMRRDGRLLATYGKGRARLTAYSTDYAFLIEGLIALFEASGDFARLEQAGELTETLLEHYWDQDAGGLFMTAGDHEELLVRSKSSQDGATPSANSVSAMNLLKLAVLLGKTEYRERAGEILKLFGQTAVGQPFQAERLLTAALAYHDGFVEIVVVGDDGDEGTQALLRECYRVYLPTKIVARISPGTASDLPLFAGRDLVDGKAAAYVCRDFVCKRPATTPEELQAQLKDSVEPGA